MRQLSLRSHDPICLTLSADARFGETDYCNDQIWDLGWWAQDIPSIWLHSSYGRRTDSIHIFPAFTLAGETRQDPSSFTEPAIVKQLFPNLACLEFKPFREVLVQADYFVPESQAIIGRYTLRNLSAAPQVVNLRLSTHMVPGSQANPMGFIEIDGVATLSGQAVDIYPVVMMSGGARKVPAAYPSLQVSGTIAPGGSKTWIWAHAGLLNRAASFSRCRELLQLPWESTLARIEMGNATLLRFETGDPDWDSALWLAQKELLRGYVGPTAHSSWRGLVARRGIHDGYALTSDGRDHTGLWGGLSTAETYYLGRQTLPIAPELVKGLLRNVMRTQNKDGELDWAPGLGGQRAGYQAMPLLAGLAWDCYLRTEDEAFLEEIFPGLFSFYDSWFDEIHDQDGDGYPEWDHAVQSGLDGRPLFNRFNPQALGFDISYVEAVDLAAYLYNEGRALIAIAEVLDQKGVTAVIEERMEALKMRLDAGWSESSQSYRHVDRDSHAFHGGLQLVRRRGVSKTKLDRRIEPPARLLLRLKGDPSAAKGLKVEIVSEGARKRKRTESLTYRRFQSFWEWSTHTTEKLNHRVHSIAVKGIEEKMTMEVLIPDLEREDLTAVLPLWAGMVDNEHARQMIEACITNPEKYWRRNGLSVIPATDKSYASGAADLGVAIHMLWNSMIGTGMVSSGYRDEAAQLFTRLITSVVEVLKREKHFYGSYAPDEAEGLETSGGIAGIVPLDLFMAVLGIRLISPTKLWVRPGNPFPWPVKLDWAGLSLTCETDATHITFPDGAKISIEGSQAQVVEQLGTPRPHVSTGSE